MSNRQSARPRREGSVAQVHTSSWRRATTRSSHLLELGTEVLHLLSESVNAVLLGQSLGDAEEGQSPASNDRKHMSSVIMWPRATSDGRNAATLHWHEP